MRYLAFFALLLLGASVARAVDLSYPVWCDTYVSQASQGTHCGDAQLLVQNDGNVAYGYVTFNLSQLRDPALLTNDPMFSFYVENSSGAPLTLYIDALPAAAPLCNACITWSQRVFGSAWSSGPIFGNGAYGFSLPRDRLAAAVNAGEVSVTLMLRCSQGSVTISSNESNSANHRPTLIGSYAGSPRPVRVAPTCALSGHTIGTVLRAMDTTLDRFAITCRSVPLIGLTFTQTATQCIGVGGSSTSESVEIRFSDPGSLTTTAIQWVVGHELTHLLCFTLSDGHYGGAEGIADWGAFAVWHAEWGEVNHGPFDGQFRPQYLDCLQNGTGGCFGSECSWAALNCFDPRDFISCGGAYCGEATTQCCCWPRDAQADFFEWLLGLSPTNLQRLDAFGSYGCPGDIVVNDQRVEEWRPDEPTGACCAGDGTCTVTLENQCPSPNVWMGSGVPCDPNPCGAGLRNPGFEDGPGQTVWNFGNTPYGDGGVQPARVYSRAEGASNVHTGDFSTIVVMSSQSVWQPFALPVPADTVITVQAYVKMPTAGSTSTKLLTFSIWGLDAQNQVLWGRGSYPDYTGPYPEWTPVTFSIQTPESAPRLAIMLDTANGNSGIGAELWIDDVSIMGTPAAVDDDPVTNLLPRVIALPNPSAHAPLLRYELPRQEEISVEVFNAAGGRVRRLVHGVQPMGVHAIEWDGRDDANHAVPSGLYLVRVETPSGQTTTRVVLAR